jgi:hypothetical protein
VFIEFEISIELAQEAGGVLPQIERAFSLDGLPAMTVRPRR